MKDRGGEGVNETGTEGAKLPPSLGKLLPSHCANPGAARVSPSRGRGGGGGSPIIGVLTATCWTRDALEATDDLPRNP